jgi:hypothetical protein
LGRREISFTDTDFTWAKYPQKSQIKSAHLKFTGSNLSERSTRLQEGQLTFFDTKFSPKSPSCCFVVAIIPPRIIAHATCLTACQKKI